MADCNKSKVNKLSKNRYVITLKIYDAHIRSVTELRDGKKLHRSTALDEIADMET